MQSHGFDTGVSEEAATTNFKLKTRTASNGFQRIFPAFPLDVETKIIGQICVQA